MFVNPEIIPYKDVDVKFFISFLKNFSVPLKNQSKKN